MKKALKIFGILALTVFAFTSCSKDDDPTKNFVDYAEYRGNISYYKGVFNEENESFKSGIIRVMVLDDNYQFSFNLDDKSAEIPSFTIKMKKGENGDIKFSDDKKYAITLNENSVNILYGDDKGVWRVNGGERKN